jgi:hypothetical protein
MGVDGRVRQKKRSRSFRGRIIIKFFNWTYLVTRLLARAGPKIFGFAIPLFEAEEAPKVG